MSETALIGACVGDQLVHIWPQQHVGSKWNKFKLRLGCNLLLAESEVLHLKYSNFVFSFSAR